MTGGCFSRTCSFNMGFHIGAQVFGSALSVPRCRPVKEPSCAQMPSPVLILIHIFMQEENNEGSRGTTDDYIHGLTDAFAHVDLDHLIGNPNTSTVHTKIAADMCEIPPHKAHKQKNSFHLVRSITAFMGFLRFYACIHSDAHLFLSLCGPTIFCILTCFSCCIQRLLFFFFFFKGCNAWYICTLLAYSEPHRATV